jgi:glycosyltransferase involved in cell wall biosynthesis
VCIAYPFFPHYRGPVLTELLTRGHHHYSLLADPVSAEPSIKVWTAPPGVRFITSKVYFGRSTVYVQPRLVWHALAGEFDDLVIHAVPWWPTTWLAAAIARLRGKRVRSWCHGWTRPERGWRGLVRRVYHRLFHEHMVYGHYAKALFMQPVGGSWPAERIHVIYNSLDYPAQRAAREAISSQHLDALRASVMKWAPGERRPIAICVTRLIPVRRLDLLIDAAAELDRQGTPIDLLIVGDGPLRAELQAHAEARSIRCVFYGPCYDEARIAELTMLADVMVAPGKVGLTAMTALAYGTPIVTHDDEAEQMPEWEALIPQTDDTPAHRATGATFRKGDVKDLARAIAQFTTRDPATRQATARACHQIIEKLWNPSRQREAIERCLDGLPADDLFWLRSAAPPENR